MWNNAQTLSRVSGWLYAAVAVLLLCSAAVWLYRSPHFPVKQVNINGRLRYSDSGQLQQVAQQYIRGNIFRADLNGAQAAFARLPWIAKAEVRRRLPDAVDISLTERIPVAHWDEGRLLDSEGNPFAATWEGDGELPEFKGQEGSGKIMAEHLDIFRRELAKQKLAVAVLSRTPRSAWEIVLDNGIRIRLGRENETERLARFVEAWPKLLRPQADRLEYVDMRYRDGFAVRLKEHGIQPAGNGMEMPSESD
ncbi:Cell division protein FtsQ [Kingella potus]|uniref:Cell division protein FtsQ n=1 Tax=Kingella potus TaxID=265175 RepID=A0A377QZW1_9NEIS|nr:cell division protein FtsQ/DivIB [Kingella potus]STR00793.1 Cell division protein FtsQ [Kingella potus]